MRRRACLGALVIALLGGCGLVGFTDTSAPVDASMDATDAADASDAAAASLCPDGTCKAVFVAPSRPLSTLGGVAGADAHCQDVALGAGVGGTFRAWFSDETSSPATRFVQAAVPYRLVNGATVANDFADLVDGTLAHAIDADVSGATITSVTEVWTGTTTAGLAEGNDCMSWTNVTSSMPFGVVGVLDRTDSGWTNIYYQFCDRPDPRVYCFEQ